MVAKVPLVISNVLIPTAYDLEIDIVPTKLNFQGQLEVQLERNGDYYSGSVEAEKFSLTLNSSNIVVTSAELIHADNLYKLGVSYDRSLETVTFSSSDELNGLSSCKLRLKYVGKISSIKTYQDETVGVFKTNYSNGLTGKADNYIISTHCQPKFARLIFPCLDELQSKPTFQLSIKTDIKYTCASNTGIKDIEIIDDVKKVVSFHRTPPMSPSVFGFIVGDFEHVEQTVTLQGDRRIPIRVYTPIGELENSSYPLSVAALALKEVESMIHHPFPLEKLDFVALPFLSDSAMEDWGLIQIQQSYLLIEPELISRKGAEAQTSGLREVIIHELVHQWVGNLVTFDDWSHLWLNESFATFSAYSVMAKLNLSSKDGKVWEDKCATDFQRVLDTDSLPTSDPIFVKHSIEVRSTQDALNQKAYHKGIPLLRMLGNLLDDESNDEYSVFLQIIGQFLDSWKFKVFKPTDLWNFISQSTLNKNKIDVTTFMHSWTRLPGYPILKVEANEKNQVKITQHRYIYGVRVESEDSFEDVPFHVPITYKIMDTTKIARQMLTDRQKVVDDIAPETLLHLNANYSNIVVVQYCSLIYANIASGIRHNLYTARDLLSVANDLNRILGQPHQTGDDVVGLFQIAEAYAASTTVLEFKSLDLVLNMVQNVSSSVELVNRDSNLKLVTKINSWVARLVTALEGKLAWTVKGVNYSKLSSEELRARNSILMMGFKLNPVESQQVIKSLYKSLIHGPKNSVPRELLNSVLAGTLHYAVQQKEYKEILALSKSPSLTVKNVVNDGGSNSEAEIRGVLQTSAVLALGYSTQPDLVAKTLNFVMTNIDSKLIELALIGIALQPNSRQRLWDWFVLHYDTWCLKTFREGSATAKQLKATLTNIAKIVFATMLNNGKTAKKLNAFVNEKMSSPLYKKFDLTGILDAVKLENEEKIKLNSHNESITTWIDDHN